MPHVLLIQDKPETIWDNEQFARMLDEKLGSDAADFFRDALHDANVNPDFQICSGECDKVYETQEHWQRIVEDACDEMGSWAIRKLTKEELINRRDELVEQLRGEL